MDMPRELERLTGLQAAFHKNIDYQGGEYGNAILSRYPILESSNYLYTMLEKREQRGLLHATIDVGGTTLIFASTHLDHSDPAERIHSANQIADVLPLTGERPVIIAGDFNDRPDSQTYRVLTSSLEDAWKHAGEGDGFTISSTQPHSRIDYVFYSQPKLLRAQSAAVIATQASDHLPLVVTFARE